MAEHAEYGRGIAHANLSLVRMGMGPCTNGGAAAVSLVADMIELYFTIVFAVIAVVEIFVGPRFWKFRKGGARQ